RDRLLHASRNEASVEANERPELNPIVAVVAFENEAVLPRRVHPARRILRLRYGFRDRLRLLFGLRTCVLRPRRMRETDEDECNDGRTEGFRHRRMTISRRNAASRNRRMPRSVESGFRARQSSGPPFRWTTQEARAPLLARIALMRGGELLLDQLQQL